MGTISQHQLSTFSSPVNATSPIDANTVRGNDNTIKTQYNAHDADATIHLQNGAVGSRPAAATAGAGAMWLATDTDAIYAWYTDGSTWYEIDYIRNTGGTITSTTGPQFTVAYDGSNKVEVSVSSAGAVTLNASGASAGFSFSDLVTGAAGVKVSGGSAAAQTITYDSTFGVRVAGGVGTNYDNGLWNRDGGSIVVGVVANSLNVDFLGAISVTGAFGCNGATARTPHTLGAAATDLASVITLANNLRTMAINNGTGVA
jgi:hypothetical protein